MSKNLHKAGMALCGSRLSEGLFKPHLNQGLHQFCYNVGQTWRFSKCLWFTTDLVCQVFLGTLDLWPTGNTVSGGGESSKPKPRHWGKGVFIVVYLVDTSTTHYKMLKLLLCLHDSLFAFTFTHCGKVSWDLWQWLLNFLGPNIYTVGAWNPLSLLLVVCGKLLLPELQDRADPLGQTVPFLLTPPRQ